ncbi:MAG TPA: hypothetical protein VLZ81_16740 [Blastocatellia bacterium]|nr:hypothetical protein [Blastocatellia bacterium]
MNRIAIIGGLLQLSQNVDVIRQTIHGQSSEIQGPVGSIHSVDWARFFSRVAKFKAQQDRFLRSNRARFSAA